MPSLNLPRQLRFSFSLLLVVTIWQTVILGTVLGTAAAAERPNVIVIMTDDQGYGEFSCHGNPITQTPHIDQLAAESIRLTDFHVAPMCTPTRGQLMTGLDAFRTGAINVSSGRTLLRPELTTMADVFREAGYRTGLFGKWHLGDNFPFRPEDRGFDEALWFPSSHINSVPDFWDNDYFDDVYLRGGKRVSYRGYCTDVFFDEAIEWMQAGRAKEQPFFGYIALNAAHSPWFVPDHYRGPIRQALKKHPEIAKGLPPRRSIEDLVSFLAMGANIDENIGKLDRFLRETGRFENTMVVFLTDNGSTMGDDYYNAGMRGKKTQLWEGGHRVPCFIRWPGGNLGPSREIAELCHVQDLLPTLAELVGAKSVPDRLDGVSLGPLLRGHVDALEERMLVINYSRMPTFKVTYTDQNPAIPQRDGAAVLWKHWRLIENRSLYNVQADPLQEHDVAAEHPEVVAKLRAHLQDWWNGVKDQVLQPQRVVIGSDAENPMLLTACEWLDVFVDQQQQVRRGIRSNGVWHLDVDQPGRYTFELRRYPEESGLKLQASLPRTRVTDGTFEPAQSLPIAKARIQIGPYEATGQPDESQSMISFSTELSPGPIELQTWMLDESEQEICGAYYVTVRRES